MTTLDILKRKLSEINKYDSILENKYTIYSKRELEKTETLRSALERNLYLLCQATIDFAEAIIAYHHYRQPGTMADSFEILWENNLISNTIREEMKNMAGFRNVLAHLYAKVDFSKLYKVLIYDRKKIRIFLEEIKGKTKLV